MKIYIKNMVAQGTRKFVLIELKKLGLKLKSFEAGELEFRNELSPAETIALEKSLSKYGLELSTEAVASELQYTAYGNDNSMQYDEDYIMELAELHEAS